ncbi:potassium channel AKT1-like protein [Tanacetum coccineum]
MESQSETTQTVSALKLPLSVARPKGNGKLGGKPKGENRQPHFMASERIESLMNNLAQMKNQFDMKKKRRIKEKDRKRKKKKEKEKSLFHAVVNHTNVDYAALLWWDFMNCVSKKKDVIQYPRFTKLIIADLMKKFSNIPQRIDEDYHSIKDDVPLVSVYTTGNVLVRGMLILEKFLTEEIRATNDYKDYETVFVNVVVPMNQPQLVVFTQGTHRSTPRAHRTPTLTTASPQGKKRKQSVRETSSPQKSLKVTIIYALVACAFTLDIKPSWNLGFRGALRRMCRRQGYMIRDMERKCVTTNELWKVHGKVDQVLHDIVPQLAEKATNDLIKGNLKRVVADTVIQERDAFQAEEEETVIDEDEVIPEDETPELIIEFQNVNKRNGNTEEKKYILSLHKIYIEIFPEADLEEKMNRWVHKEFKNFNEDARENDKPDSLSEADFKYLNKNDIKDFYYLCRNKKANYRETKLMNSSITFIRSCVIWERVHDFSVENRELSNQDSEGQTPLHWAVDRDHVKAAKLLLIRNANVNLKVEFEVELSQRTDMISENSMTWRLEQGPLLIEKTIFLKTERCAGEEEKSLDNKSKRFLMPTKVVEAFLISRIQHFEHMLGFRPTCFTKQVERLLDSARQMEDSVAVNLRFYLSLNGEDIQVLRYESGKKYDPHFDYFNDPLIVRRGGHHIGNVLMYLSDVEKGGATFFHLKSFKHGSSRIRHIALYAYAVYALKCKFHCVIKYGYGNIMDKADVKHDEDDKGVIKDSKSKLKRHMVGNGKINMDMINELAEEYMEHVERGKRNQRKPGNYSGESKARNKRGRRRETLDEFIRGPGIGDRTRAMVGRNVSPRGYSERQSYRVKAEIPNFVGNLDIEAVLDWLNEVNKFFNIMDVSEEEQVKTTRGYLDEDETDDQRTVADYTGEFLRLQARCNLRETDEQSAARRKSMASKTGVGFRCINMESSNTYGSRSNQIKSTIPSTTTTTSCSKASGNVVDTNKESQPVNSNPYARPTVESGNEGLIIDEAFQEEDKELEYVEPLDEEVEQVTYVVQRTLCSLKTATIGLYLTHKPDRRVELDTGADTFLNSLPHAHAQSTKTFYKHQDSRIMKAQELKTKTSAQTLIYKIFLQRYQVYQGRLLASFQDDAKYEHVGQDTRSQGGKDDQDKRIKI